MKVLVSSDTIRESGVVGCAGSGVGITGNAGCVGAVEEGGVVISEL